MVKPPLEKSDNAARLPFSFDLAQELLATYGSPLYVYDGDRLRQTIRHITRSIPYSQTQFQFASVTNGNLSLLRIFREAGWGLHANTPGDIYLGLHAGFHPRQIVYSGSNLNRAEMAQVLAWNIGTLNLDSLSQLQLFCEVYTESSRQPPVPQPSPPTPHPRKNIQPAPFPSPLSPPSSPLSPFSSPRLGLRLNHPELTGDSRIGVRPAEFSNAVAIARQAGLKITGLHFYRGTGTNATSAFTRVIDTLLEIGQFLPDWEYLDFGGGFGYPYHHHKAAFDWAEFGRVLTDHLNHLNQPLELVIEPGRAAIAGCATLLTQVVSVKWQDHQQIVGTDTTVANLSVPSVHGGYREIVAWIPLPPSPTDICGNTTYSRDYLGRNCQLPPLQIGDILAILDVGAYGYAMSSHFLHRPRPAEVLLENHRHRLIRKREDYDILLHNQVF
jgi:diaminopimelate decarboxylase